MQKEPDKLVDMIRPDGQPVTVNVTLYPYLVKQFQEKGFKIGKAKSKKIEAPK